MHGSADHGVRFGRVAATLPVGDMDRACTFYGEILGFRKTFQNGDPVGFVILKRDAAEIHLALQTGCKPQPFNAAHLLVEDAEELYAYCQRQGLRIIRTLCEKDYGVKGFVFEDPDGNRIDVGRVVR